MFRDGTARLLVFRLGSERFAIELATVSEVVDAPRIEPMPDSAPGLLGVASIHDILMSVYDVRPLLNVAGLANGAALVFAHRERAVALAVDDVFDTITIDAGELRPAPAARGGDAVLLGIVRRDGELVAVLDAAALLAAVTLAGVEENR